MPPQLPPPLTETHYAGFGSRYQGKVRDVYRPGDGRLVLVTTDRISAFDHVLRQAIPLKGQVLNRLAGYFFEKTVAICPNHVLARPDPNVTIATECEALPIEFVVRGYLAGHAWRVYQAGGRELCGEMMPDGLVEGSKLTEPLLTPATKATAGHDEDISRNAIVERGLLNAETLDEASQYALSLYRCGTELAARQGLILVDTKYEFGRAPDGRLLVIDEVHTPDSSRYYYAEGYEERLERGEAQRQLSKEFVREWLMARGFQGRDGQHLPDMPPAFVREIAERYVELYETVTGTDFEPDLDPNPLGRIQNAVENALAS